MSLQASGSEPMVHEAFVSKVHSWLQEIRSSPGELALLWSGSLQNSNDVYLPVGISDLQKQLLLQLLCDEPLLQDIQTLSPSPRINLAYHDMLKLVVYPAHSKGQYLDDNLMPTATGSGSDKERSFFNSVAPRMQVVVDFVDHVPGDLLILDPDGTFQRGVELALQSRGLPPCREQRVTRRGGTISYSTLPSDGRLDVTNIDLVICLRADVSIELTGDSRRVPVIRFYTPCGIDEVTMIALQQSGRNWLSSLSSEEMLGLVKHELEVLQQIPVVEMRPMPWGEIYSSLHKDPITGMRALASALGSPPYAAVKDFFESEHLLSAKRKLETYEQAEGGGKRIKSDGFSQSGDPKNHTGQGIEGHVLISEPSLIETQLKLKNEQQSKPVAIASKITSNDAPFVSVSVNEFPDALEGETRPDDGADYSSGISPEKLSKQGLIDTKMEMHELESNSDSQGAIELSEKGSGAEKYTEISSEEEEQEQAEQAPLYRRLFDMIHILRSKLETSMNRNDELEAQHYSDANTISLQRDQISRLSEEIRELKAQASSPSAKTTEPSDDAREELERLKALVDDNSRQVSYFQGLYQEASADKLDTERRIAELKETIHKLELQTTERASEFRNSFLHRAIARMLEREKLMKRRQDVLQVLYQRALDTGIGLAAQDVAKPTM